MIHPAAPAPIKLRDEVWTTCENGTMICMTPKEAEKTLANKTIIGRWMSRTANVIAYYREVLP